MGAADAERARLHELMAVAEAERTVNDVRMAELKATHELLERAVAAGGMGCATRHEQPCRGTAAAGRRLAPVGVRPGPVAPLRQSSRAAGLSIQ